MLFNITYERNAAAFSKKTKVHFNNVCCYISHFYAHREEVKARIIQLKFRL